MARPATTISCPVCSQPFNAQLEQIIDVQFDPTAKERLLSGRVNLVTCPHCGYRGMVGTPLLYHDASHQLAVVYVPMELNIGTEDRERVIGEMTNALMRALPEDTPKGHLLAPSMALTLQGLIDQVLEADGITPDMIDAERKKVELIDQLAEANEEERQVLLEENWDLFDLTFLELLTASAQAASQAEQSRRALRLFNIRTYLMENTEAGQQLKEQQDMIAEASQELQALGQNVTREAFVDLLLNAAGQQAKVEALAMLGRPLVDYQTFQMITDVLDGETDEQKRREYGDLRDTLLEVSAAFERQTQAVAQRAADTLRMLLTAPDVRQAIANNIDRIDDTFLQVLQINLDEARKAGNAEVSAKLRDIRDTVLQLIQASAPPELQLINDLLSAEEENEAFDLLRERQDQLSEEILTVMEDLSGQLREHGSEAAAQRLDKLRVEAQKLI